MKSFKKFTSLVVPLPLKDIDTDMIIPARYLTSVSRAGYGESLFRGLRDTDPSFPLNQDTYKGAQILMADSNFGCGSSREHAVWALLGAGFRAIIAPSFADIFASNSVKNGLVLITLDYAVIHRLLDEAQTGKLELTVNLEAQSISKADGESFAFPFDPFRKHCILNGLDDLDYLLSKREQIADFIRRNSVNFFVRPINGSPI